MAITNKQQEPSTNNDIPKATKPHDLVLEEIKSFHESLESERVHRVLIRWRKRKRDEELSNGTAILEKILRTLHEEIESRKERAELWDKALIAELQPDRARQELDGRAAVSALSAEKQTQFVHAVASVLNIEVSGEEVGKMLSKTTGLKAPATEPPRSMPPTPPSERRSPVMTYDTRRLEIDTHIGESSPRGLSVAPRTPAPPSRPASQTGSRDDFTTYSQGLRPQGPGDIISPSRDADAAKQEVESRRPVGLEDKSEIYSYGSQYPCIRLNTADARRGDLPSGCFCLGEVPRGANTRSYSGTCPMSALQQGSSTAAGEERRCRQSP